MKFDKTSLFLINRKKFFKEIMFSDNVKLINAVKTDFNRLTIIINNQKFTNYLKFLETVKKYYSKYQLTIYTLCNQCAHFYYYKIIFSIISKYNYHISTSKKILNNKLETNFNLNLINKQVMLSNNYDIYKIENEMHIYRIIKVDIIIDLDTLDNILLKIKYF